MDAWRLQNRAIGELFDIYPWIEDMFISLSTGVVKSAHWGLAFRVTSGAVTSIVDLLTDLYVTKMFYTEKKMGYFAASIASLATSITLQLFMVFGQNRKMGMRRVLREMFPVLIGFKPAVDAYRVATLAVQQEDQALSPFVEMVAARSIEMFAEAIPGVIIQLMAILTTESGVSVSTGAWTSVVVSGLATGFISATISYDFDTDPTKRLQQPDFYGYVPSKSSHRTIVFSSMVLFSAGILLIKCTTIVVLGLIGKKWAYGYIALDLGLFVLFKVVTRDFWVWMPFDGAVEAAIISFIHRIIIKVITDFASIIQFRHPYDVGGVYWVFGFVLTMGSLPIAIAVAVNKTNLPGQVVAETLAKVLIPFTALSFIVFFLNIKRKYWKTFFTYERGIAYTVRIFKECKEEPLKAEIIFGTSKVR